MECTHGYHTHVNCVNRSGLSEYRAPQPDWIQIHERECARSLDMLQKAHSDGLPFVCFPFTANKILNPLLQKWLQAQSTIVKNVPFIHILQLGSNTLAKSIMIFAFSVPLRIFCLCSCWLSSSALVFFHSQCCTSLGMAMQTFILNKWLIMPCFIFRHDFVLVFARFNYIFQFFIFAKLSPASYNLFMLYVQCCDL